MAAVAALPGTQLDPGGAVQADPQADDRVDNGTDDSIGHRGASTGREPPSVPACAGRAPSPRPPGWCRLRSGRWVCSPARGAERGQGVELGDTVVAGNYLAAYPEPTVQEIWKALAVNEAFQRVLDDPAAAEALQHPALKPLLDKPLPEPAGAAGPVGAAPAPASAVEPDGTPSTPHTGVRGRREEWTFDFRFTQPTSGSGDDNRHVHRPRRSDLVPRRRRAAQRGPRAAHLRRTPRGPRPMSGPSTAANRTASAVRTGWSPEP